MEYCTKFEKFNNNFQTNRLKIMKIIYYFLFLLKQDCENFNFLAKWTLLILSLWSSIAKNHESFFWFFITLYFLIHLIFKFVYLIYSQRWKFDSKSSLWERFKIEWMIYGVGEIKIHDTNPGMGGLVKLLNFFEQKSSVILIFI